MLLLRPPSAVMMRMRMSVSAVRRPVLCPLAASLLLRFRRAGTELIPPTQWCLPFTRHNKTWYP